MTYDSDPLVSIEHAAALVSMFVGLGTLYLLWKQTRKIEVLHKATNSMKDELVAAVRAEAYRLGLAAGRAELKDNPPDTT